MTRPWFFRIAVGGVLALELGCSAAGVAFRGAVGSGRESRGGRGGAVIHVKNLADRGLGSLRWACEEVTGPRTIVFDVGGTIRLTKTIRLRGDAGSYVTIAGQTAPGGGIQLVGWGITIGQGGHDIIVRFLRIRPGYTHDRDWNKDAITICGNTSGAAHDIMIDHCSLAWAIDEVANVWDNAHRITFSNCIMAEGSTFGHRKGSHSCAFLAGGENPVRDDYLTITGCLLTGCAVRNPQISTLQPALTHVVNNVIYNWGSYATTINYKSRVNVVGNVYLRGPAAVTSVRRPIDVSSKLAPQSLYVADNLYNAKPPNFQPPAADPWNLVGDRGGRPSAKLPAPARLRAAEPLGRPPPIIPASEVLARVVKNVGATVPIRDALDARLIRELQTGKGTVGFGTKTAYTTPPVLATGPVRKDTDGDAMPDDWERAHGLDPQSASDSRADPDGNGLTNLQEYLGFLAGD